jgi:predicted DNA-binding transcriptional regulator AlpA
MKQLPEKEIQRINDLVDRGWGSRTTLWRLIKAGKIPEPFDFLGRPAWSLRTIREFENSQAGDPS